MKPLEGMALDLFNKFSIKEIGKPSSWAHLSNDRKLEWMAEILVIAEYFYKEIFSSIKPLPDNQKTDTSYGNGFNDGVRSQRNYFVSFFEEQFQKLLDEYEDFEYSVKGNK